MTEQITEYKASSNGKSVNDIEVTKPKQRRKTCGIPVVKSLSEMLLVHYSARIEQQPTEWNRIKNYEFYSPASDGSRLMQKITRSKSLDLQTRETLPTAYGQAYLVHIEANPSADKADF